MNIKNTLPPKNISIRNFHLLHEIFLAQNWEIENDFVFNRFCETLSFLDEKQQICLLELTRKFLRIDFSKYLYYLRSALQNIKPALLENITTIYVSPLIAAKDLGRPKSSIMIARLLAGRELRAKDILKVSNLVLLDRTETLHSISDKDGWLILLVDDFIGTGETAEEALTELINEMKIDKSRIMVLSLIAQQVGYEKLVGNQINVFCAEVKRKGISDEFSDPIKTEYIKAMISIENILKVKDDFRFGYKGSEALVTLDRTPNNTFPVYWLEKKIQGKMFIAPFPRDQ